MYKVERKDRKVRVVNQASGGWRFEADEDSYLLIEKNLVQLKNLPDEALLKELTKWGKLS
jgi:hypothetical protein